METSTTQEVKKPTIEELRAQLKEAEAEELREKEAKKKTYLKTRDALAKELIQDANELSGLIEKFKEASWAKVKAFRSEMLEYGELRKGEGQQNYSFTNSDDTCKIDVSVQAKMQFDERAASAEVHLKNFLNSFVKKKDLPTYELVTSLLEKNGKTGQYDISNINRLYQLEDRFDNEDWKKAIRLFKESYRETGSSSYIRFYLRDAKSKWKMIPLNIASI